MPLVIPHSAYICNEDFDKSMIALAISYECYFIYLCSELRMIVYECLYSVYIYFLAKFRRCSVPKLVDMVWYLFFYEYSAYMSKKVSLWDRYFSGEMSRNAEIYQEPYVELSNDEIGKLYNVVHCW